MDFKNIVNGTVDILCGSVMFTSSILMTQYFVKNYKTNITKIREFLCDISSISFSIFVTTFSVKMTSKLLKDDM